MKKLTRNYSKYFPPVDPSAPEHKPDDREQSTEPSELLSQLPDAPTTDPQEADGIRQPSLKKQKTAEADSEDEFVVINKEDVKDEQSKSEL